MCGRRSTWQKGLVGGLGFLLVATILAFTATGVSAKGEDEERAVQGRTLFEQRCTACHAFGRTVVGPDLQGVTERREESWLRTQVQSPSVHRTQNDPTAKANLQKYGVPMPDLGLTNEQTEAVIAYLKTATTAGTAAVGIPAQYVPTLVIGLLAIIGLTLIGLVAGTKRVEVRP